MSVLKINSNEFNGFTIIRHPMAALFVREVAWYKTTNNELLGTVVQDNTDKDYSYTVLSCDAGKYRCIDAVVSIKDQETAETLLISHMEKMKN